MLSWRSIGREVNRKRKPAIVQLRARSFGTKVPQDDGTLGTAFQIQPLSRILNV